MCMEPYMVLRLLYQSIIEDDCDDTLSEKVLEIQSLRDRLQFIIGDVQLTFCVGDTFVI